MHSPGLSDPLADSGQTQKLTINQILTAAILGFMSYTALFGPKGNVIKGALL